MPVGTFSFRLSSVLEQILTVFNFGRSVPVLTGIAPDLNALIIL